MAGWPSSVETSCDRSIGEPRLVSGGSVGNSVIAFSQLGGDAAFIGCVGDDRYGLFYEAEMQELEIDVGNPAIVGATTGTCVCLITPDAERTMRTCLAVSSHLAEKHIVEERIAQSDWLFVEGYLFANPMGQGAVKQAIRLAKKHGTKVAVTCSEAFIVEVFGAPFFEALKDADLLFCNEPEGKAVAKAASAEEAFAKLKDIVPSAVVTSGPHGVYVRHEGVEKHVPAFPCEPKDLTGAGVGGRAGDGEQALHHRVADGCEVEQREPDGERSQQDQRRAPSRAPAA